MLSGQAIAPLQGQPAQRSAWLPRRLLLGRGVPSWAEIPGGTGRGPAAPGCSSPLGAVLIYQPNCVHGPWRFASSDISPGVKFPAGKGAVLRISHPEHPRESRRDDSRVSLSNGPGKSLRPHAGPLAPLGSNWKSARTVTQPQAALTEQIPQAGGDGGTR